MKKRTILLLLLAALLLTTAFSASAATATQTDIGCYEYGYSAQPGVITQRKTYPSSLYIGDGEGTTYYIDPNGSDSTGDGSQGAAWQTLAYLSRASSLLSPRPLIIMRLSSV